MLLAIALVAVLGPSLVNVRRHRGDGWVGYARPVRGQVLRAREFEYVPAAKALGAGTARGSCDTVADALQPLLVQSHSRHGRAILSEAALSFWVSRAAAAAELGPMLMAAASTSLDAPHLRSSLDCFCRIVRPRCNFLGDASRRARSDRKYTPGHRKHRKLNQGFRFITGKRR